MNQVLYVKFYYTTLSLLQLNHTNKCTYQNKERVDILIYLFFVTRDSSVLVGQVNSKYNNQTYNHLVIKV